MKKRGLILGRKKAVLIVMVVLSISLFSIQGNVYAHKPSDTSLDYNESKQSLEVTITHTVSNRMEHYVERIEVMKNGEVLLEEDYNEQPSDSTFTYSYDVEAVTGDTFEVKAYCNRFGTITGTLEISEDDETTTDGNGGTSYILITGVGVAILVIIGILAYTRREVQDSLSRCSERISIGCYG